MSYVKRKTYAADPVILVNPGLNEAVVNVALPNTKITANSDGRKVVDAGRFVALDSGGYVRPLPRETLTTATTTGSTAVVVSDASVFAVNDVLKVVEPSAIYTIGGTIAADDTVTAVIGGHSVTFTATTTTLADAATGLAALINTNVNTSQIAKAIAYGAVIRIFAKDGITNLSLTASKVGTNVTVTAGASALAAGVAVGTISSINTTTNTITLTGNASTALPVGTNIGVEVSDVYGLLINSYDLTDQSPVNVGLFVTAAGVRENLLPYIDGDIKRRFPKILFRSKF